MEALGRLAAVVVLLVGIFVGSLWALRTDFIYLFTETGAGPADLPRTSVELLPAHGEDPALEVWVTQPEPGHPVFIYFMGDVGALSVYEPRLRDIAEAGFGIAAMAYRGGGAQPGEPSEAALFRDARRLYAGLDQLFPSPIDENKRVIYGFSLGAAIAARLAAEQEELTVILEAPFTRLCDATTGLIGLLPGCWMLAGEEYETQGHIDEVGAPLLILHGTADDRVPLRQAQELFTSAQEPKFMKTYEGGGHEDLGRFGATQDMLTFVRVLAGMR